MKMQSTRTFQSTQDNERLLKQSLLQFTYLLEKGSPEHAKEMAALRAELKATNDIEGVYTQVEKIYKNLTNGSGTLADMDFYHVNEFHGVASISCVHFRMTTQTSFFF